MESQSTLSNIGYTMKSAHAAFNFYDLYNHKQYYYLSPKSIHYPIYNFM